MTATTHVYMLQPSFEEDRTTIDFELEVNRSVDWGLVDEIVRAERSLDEYRPFQVTVDAADALEWDSYVVPGTLGLLSQKATELLRPFGSKCFDFLQASMNNTPYWLLKRKDPLDCLDRERSVLVPFRSDPTRIKEIKKYRFKKDMIDDPLLFCIPESFGSLFATQSIHHMIAAKGLRGFYAEDADKSG